jgi:hypothetical protein
MIDGGVRHFPEMATQRGEEEESRDSRVPGFGTNDAFRHFLFVPVLYLGCFKECMVWFDQWSLLARLGTSHR